MQNSWLFLAGGSVRLPRLLCYRNRGLSCGLYKIAGHLVQCLMCWLFVLLLRIVWKGMKNSKVLVRGIPWLAGREAVGWKSQRVQYRSPWMIFQILANNGQEPHLFLGVALNTQNAAFFQLECLKENFLWGSILARAALAAPFYVLLALRYTTHTHTHQLNPWAESCSLSPFQARS